jgi:AraC-like DNA-binding protein
VLTAAAKQLKVPDFGLQLSREQDISVLGAVAMIARYSKDIASAIEGVARHLPYHTPGATLHLQDGDTPDEIRVCYGLRLGEETPRAQIMELSYGVALDFFRMISGETGADWQILFRHDPAGTPSLYRRRFRGQLHFGQSADVLVLPRRLLALPINPDSIDLRATTERLVSHVLKRHPLDIGAQVAALIARQLAGGGCGIERIARQLGLHARTLQRQLSAQGLYFEDIMDSLRRERAEEFLRHSVVPLVQVAALLGYTEQTSFNRACKRWFGVTPMVWRRNALRQSEN